MNYLVLYEASCFAAWQIFVDIGSESDQLKMPSNSFFHFCAWVLGEEICWSDTKKSRQYVSAKKTEGFAIKDWLKTRYADAGPCLWLRISIWFCHKKSLLVMNKQCN